MFKGKSPKDFQNSLFSLLPKGRLWTRDRDTDMGDLLLGIAQEFSRTDQRVYDFIRETFASKTDELIELHERDYGLPNPNYNPPDTLEQRREILLAKKSEIGRLDKAYFVELAKTFGYDVEIRTYQPGWCGYLACGDPCGPVSLINYWDMLVDFHHSYDVNRNLNQLRETIEESEPAKKFFQCYWSGMEFTNSFNNAFDGSVYNDNTYYPGSFGSEFDLGFKNNYFYSGEHLTGAFTVSFNYNFDVRNGGGFSEEFSHEFNIEN